MLWSLGFWQRVVLPVDTCVSCEHSASIFKFEVSYKIAPQMPVSLTDKFYLGIGQCLGSRTDHDVQRDTRMILAWHLLPEGRRIYCVLGSSANCGRRNTKRLLLVLSWPGGEHEYFSDF
jgi:hypothetical protein